MGEEEQTLATEVRELFQLLAKKPDRAMQEAFAAHTDTSIGSDKFFLALAAAKANCDQLITDINASSLKQGSKNLYTGAVTTLSNYLTLANLQGTINANLRNEKQAFEYLVLVDDYLRPLDRRSVSDDFLDSLIARANEMLASLGESDVEPRLKAFLAAQISNFIWSVGNYRVLGIEGVTRAWGSMAAEIARSQGMTGSRKPEAQAWYKKALPVLGAIGLAVTSVSATVEQADNLLTHGEHIVKVVTGEGSDATDEQSRHDVAVELVDEEVVSPPHD